MPLVNCLECTKEISSNAASCPSCGSPLSTVNTIQKKEGWSWMGFLFSYVYYLGYDTKKGVLLMLAYFVFPPVMSFILPFYGGFNANKDLPIGKVQYSWGKMLLVNIPANIIYWIFCGILLSAFSQK